MNPGKYIATALLLTSTTLAADPAADPIAWLERMARSAQQQNYEGTFVYRVGDRLQSLRIIHSAGPDTVRERLIALSGPPREVIREGDRVVCVLPDSQAVLVNRLGEQSTLPLALPSRLAALETFYDIALGAEERVAGQRARKVLIRPKDRFRYGHNYWIAGDTGLLLQAELIDHAERVIEEVVFTSLIRHDRVPPQLLESENVAQLRAQELAADRLGRPVAVSGWRVDDLPPGFRKTVHRDGPVHPGTPSVEHMVFSDGLASVSVFVEEAAEGEPLTTAHRHGPLHARSRVIGRYRVTVLGEVPAATVERIVKGVRPRSEAAE